MTDEDLIAALANALHMPLPSEYLGAVAAQFVGQVTGQGGFPAGELEGVEPASLFDPAALAAERTDT